MNSLSALLQPSQVLLDVEAASKAALLEFIGQQVQVLHGVDAQRVSRSLSLREQAGSTGLGKGFAIPHARLAELDRTLVVYIRLAHAIEFGAVDCKPVTEVLVLLVPQPACQVHLDLLAEATYLFSSSEFRYWLKECQSVDEILQLFDSFELPDVLTPATNTSN